MSFLDLIFLIPCAYFLIQGLRKGILIQVFSFIALLVAVIGSLKLTHTVVTALGLGDKSAVTPYITYLLVFIILFVAVIFAAKIIERILKTVQLNLFNRIAGAIFGIFKAVFFVSLLYWITDQANILNETQKESSFFFLKLKNVAPAIISFITNNLSIAKNIIFHIEEFFGMIAGKI